MNEILQALHIKCLQIAELEFKPRLHALCQYFLGVKYGAWENGSNIESLDDFNYDLTTLDCVTYVEVILALVKTRASADFDTFTRDFLNNLRRIHYAGGIPNFLNSNHFTCVDWIVNNRYLLDDMTQTLSKNTKIASTVIDKLAWFKKHKISKGQNQAFPKHLESVLASVHSQIPYIATDELLNNYSKFVDIFPSYCIVNIVRPNWNLVERIGTHLNISHLGFAIKHSDGKQIDFFHSTIEKMIAVQETLDVYMQRHKDSPTIAGINVLAISPGFSTSNPQTR